MRTAGSSSGRTTDTTTSNSTSSPAHTKVAEVSITVASNSSSRCASSSTAASHRKVANCLGAPAGASLSLNGIFGLDVEG
mmetsp:Transcript_51334/g.111410  ORF Transcript_51334/g.111410 Transcript_51334/m.111410 type:complete len:80 (+) Transcript_51334:259-498(+)|eukprot:CAMPEP_0206583368 /NCGR_PEP_ID=MMETSP0325_2-20121206/35063_1 /ASSEMBLY_ACC=CAM_ASM_000347 /TAXON_ID=2866 /ORGANISM="Crypthecodinium cohnii, Strain Seligo" /LENGTH=79 /DNA_ID=CAMNT_0054090277 /DNA_START=238 /DNA_END=477 /DNA_ORIENTATION=-